MNKESIDARNEIINVVYKNKVRVHFGASFSIIEILIALYNNVLRNNEKFILSKGHASMTLYFILYRKGYLTKEEFENAYIDGQELMGHPVMNDNKGIYFSTGSLGLGISLGIGDAMSNKLLNNNKNTYVLIGDGELEEGSVWESILFIAQNKIDNIIVILDNNRMQCDDYCDNIIGIKNKKEIFRNMGFEVEEVDGHNIEQIIQSMETLKNIKNKPKFLIANTIKGKGISFMENSTEWHYKGLNEEDYKKAIEEVNKLYDNV